jgi:hypothetical protein
MPAYRRGQPVMRETIISRADVARGALNFLNHFNVEFFKNS